MKPETKKSEAKKTGTEIRRWETSGLALRFVFRLSNQRLEGIRVTCFAGPAAGPSGAVEGETTGGSEVVDCDPVAKPPSFPVVLDASVTPFNLRLENGVHVRGELRLTQLTHEMSDGIPDVYLRIAYGESTVHRFEGVLPWESAPDPSGLGEES